MNAIIKPDTAATATLSSKFQISIPKSVRDGQRWRAGQEFVFIPKGKGVLVMPVPELAQLAGLAKGARTAGYRDRKDRF
ncbi:MAG: AbrB/MazE/SpoVT family DNA-binding domain-containing protein [Pseudoxanthomonas sp.]